MKPITMLLLSLLACSPACPCEKHEDDAGTVARPVMPPLEPDPEAEPASLEYSDPCDRRERVIVTTADASIVFDTSIPCRRYDQRTDLGRPTP